MRSALRKFTSDNSGATAIEYGLIGVIISITIIASVESIGEGSVVGYFQAIIDAFTSLL